MLEKKKLDLGFLRPVNRKDPLKESGKGEDEEGGGGKEEEEEGGGGGARG